MDLRDRWLSKVDRDVVAAGADGADAADSTDMVARFSTPAIILIVRVPARPSRFWASQYYLPRTIDP
jgi:hypothetical protein